MGFCFTTIHDAMLMFFGCRSECMFECLWVSLVLKVGFVFFLLVEEKSPSYTSSSTELFTLLSCLFC